MDARSHNGKCCAWKTITIDWIRHETSLQKLLKKLRFQESRGHAAKERCVREVWRQSARLKATENVCEIDVCPWQLTLREIVSKNAAPLRKKNEKTFVFQRCRGYATKSTLHPLSSAPQRASQTDGLKSWNRWFLSMIILMRKTSQKMQRRCENCRKNLTTPRSVRPWVWRRSARLKDEQRAGGASQDLIHPNTRSPAPGGQLS